MGLNRLNASLDPWLAGISARSDVLPDIDKRVEIRPGVNDTLIKILKELKKANGELQDVMERLWKPPRVISRQAIKERREWKQMKEKLNKTGETLRSLARQDIQGKLE